MPESCRFCLMTQMGGSHDGLTTLATTSLLKAVVERVYLKPGNVSSNGSGVRVKGSTKYPDSGDGMASL